MYVCMYVYIFPKEVLLSAERGPCWPLLRRRQRARHEGGVSEVVHLHFAISCGAFFFLSFLTAGWPFALWPVLLWGGLRCTGPHDARCLAGCHGLCGMLVIFPCREGRRAVKPFWFQLASRFWGGLRLLCPGCTVFARLCRRCSPGP